MTQCNKGMTVKKWIMGIIHIMLVVGVLKVIL